MPRLMSKTETETPGFKTQTQIKTLKVECQDVLRPRLKCREPEPGIQSNNLPNNRRVDPLITHFIKITNLTFAITSAHIISEIKYEYTMYTTVMLADKVAHHSQIIYA